MNTCKRQIYQSIKILEWMPNYSENFVTYTNNIHYIYNNGEERKSVLPITTHIAKQCKKKNPLRIPNVYSNYQPKKDDSTVESEVYKRYT